ncbi:MAG: dihydroorotase family protein [Candidatus Thorarchaeota archaeon]|nr:dihydroorotase family protein [Candidatus Thorarchaeota archaeon]
MTVDLVLKDGIVVVRDRETVLSVSIDRGKIEGIYKHGEEPESRKIIDSRGLYILPGLIDMHVHLRDLDQCEKEDYETGTMAAAAGGVTTVVDMPNSNPPVLSRKVLDRKIESASAKRYVNVGFYAGIPKSIPIFERSIVPNILGFKVYPHSPLTKGTEYTKKRIKDCLELAKENDLPLLFHPDSSKKDDIADDQEEFFSIHSCESEVSSLQAFLDAKVEYEARMHVCHVSCAATARLILKHRAEHTLTAEVTPHHMFLSGGDFAHDNGVAKMLPPLRSPYDSKMLSQALCQQCAIDCVASDHAPHKESEKLAPFLEAASGIPGLETTLPLMLTEVFEGRLMWVDYLRCCCSGPATILGISNKGILAEGYDADIVLVRKEEWQIKGAHFFSRAKITPFEGRRVLARPITTIVGGEIVYSNGRFVIGPGIAGRVPVRKG